MDLMTPNDGSYTRTKLSCYRGFESITLREKDCFLLGKFLPGRSKCILTPSATLEPYSESQVKESPQAPREKVWYHAKHSRF